MTAVLYTSVVDSVMLDGRFEMSVDITVISTKIKAKSLKYIAVEEVAKPTYMWKHSQVIFVKEKVTEEYVTRIEKVIKETWAEVNKG